MKIKKHGKPLTKDFGKLSFTCERCGCEFVSTSKEYESMRGERILSDTIFKRMMQACWVVSVYCPDCGFKIHKNQEDIDEPPYKYESLAWF